MITIETQVSGSQIGGQLQGDPEELAYALAAIADGMCDELGEEVGGYLWGDAQEPVIQLLENLLSALKGGAA
ncbi:hypothetical protein [Paracoccus sp. 22332]|uniref:hypothetical protein n=1 Tax=Paracoccus sp. 22332 TaxID=3453913 RepID=UPI003F836281